MAKDKPLDLTTAQNTKNHRVARTLFERLHKYSQFDIGDILVERWRWSDKDKWQYEEVQRNSGIRYKFRVVARDEHGMTYARRINSGGKMGAVFCLETYRPHCEYVLDDCQVDAILLDGKYDPNADMRKVTKIKEEIRKYNKSIAFHAASADALFDWFEKNLTPGTKVWYTYQRSHVGIDWWHGVVKTAQKERQRVWDSTIRKNVEKDVIVVELADSSRSSSSQLHSHNLWDYYQFSLVEPKALTKEAL